MSFFPRRSASVNPLSSTIPGRRTLISGLSVLGKLTREIKYVTPGRSRSWRWKHEGAVPHSSAIWSLTLISGVEFRIHGWDAISNVRSLSVFPGPERMTDPHVQITLWPTPRGSFFVADPHAIKVRGCRIDFPKSTVADRNRCDK